MIFYLVVGLLVGFISFIYLFKEATQPRIKYSKDANGRGFITVNVNNNHNNEITIKI